MSWRKSWHKARAFRRHLKILADAGVLERRKEGSWVFLTLADLHRSNRCLL